MTISISISAPPRPAFLDGPAKGMLIDGRWVPARSGETFETINPANGQCLTRVASASAEDVDLAVAAARRAFESPGWSTMGPSAREQLLHKIADLMERHLDELAEIEALDNGTPLAFAKMSLMAHTIGAFRYYAGWPSKLQGDVNPSDPGAISFTFREPVGVCAGIIPWNAPLPMAAWKIAPALACGNTVVLKPAEQTSLSALRLGELLCEAGVPDGVVNIVTGYGHTAGAAMAEHPGIDKLAFTGSTEVGKKILQASAGNLKRITLELGGKSPHIIFDDADIAMSAVVAANWFCLNTGQMCLAGTRIFVQESIHEAFVEALAATTAHFKVGDPFAPDTTMGPLVSADHFRRVTSYFKRGREDGASLRVGGEAFASDGYFVPPTIFDNVNNKMAIGCEEIFGPVASIIPFKDEADVVAQANDTRYGLAAAVATRDISRAHRVAKAIKAGTVWINTYGELDLMSPFGGFKQSGLGRELGAQSLNNYTESKTVFLRL